MHSNTRLAAASQEEELPQTGASRQVPGGEYAHVATPSMEPGVDTTPLMTWGQLGGTPLRLDPPDPTESYASGSKAPEFRILNAPEREQLGRHISQKATASLKHDTVGTRTPLHGTPLATPRSAQVCRVLALPCTDALFDCCVAATNLQRLDIRLTVFLSTDVAVLTQTVAGHTLAQRADDGASTTQACSCSHAGQAAAVSRRPQAGLHSTHAKHCRRAGMLLCSVSGANEL